jgi:hypothetical protein
MKGPFLSSMRSDRNGKHGKIKADPRSVNRLLLIIVLILVVIVAAEIFALLSITSIDRRFTRSVQRGLYDGWSLSKSETQLQETGRITDTAFIEAERSAISEYIRKKYKDDDLGHLANEYISALNKCHNAAASHDPAKDYEGFWPLFSEPYGRRVKAVYEMYKGDYGLVLDDPAYEKEITNLLSQGWLIDATEKLSFSNTTKDGVRTFSAELQNESGCYIEYLNLDIELLDNNGKTVETSSVFVTDIPPDEMMKLQFICTSSKAVRYRIASENFRFRPE